MSDQIKLAETMGWTPLDGKLTGWFLPPGVPETLEGISQRQWRDDLPDPFTDANDDYAVLAYFRHEITDPVLYQAFQFSMPDDPIDYEIGDYARAALKVIDDE